MSLTERTVSSERKIRVHKATTLYLLNPDRTHVLLLKHKGFNAWLPPGGHVDDGEMPFQSTLRECGEETGFWDITLLRLNAGKLSIITKDPEDQIQLEPTTFMRKGARLAEKPFAVIREKIREHNREEENLHVQEHFHNDYIFVGQLNSYGPINLDQIEAEDYQWLPLKQEAIEQLDTFPGVKAVLGKIKRIF